MRVSPKVSLRPRDDRKPFAFRRVPWCGSLQRVDGPLIELGWLKSNGVRGIVDQQLSGIKDWGAQLWNLLMLVCWAEVYGVAGGQVEVG